jgi:hypothetical protein
VFKVLDQADVKTVTVSETGIIVTDVATNSVVSTVTYVSSDGEKYEVKTVTSVATGTYESGTL